MYLVARRIPGAKAVLHDNSGTRQNSPLAFEILTGTRKKLAGNEKDKIIALYGLFTEIEIPFPKPDYSLSVEDIYRQATAASIRYDKTLYILYHVPSNKRRKSLESWVPDWAERGFEPGDGRYGVLHDRFAASGPGRPIFRFSGNAKALILRGKIIDTVIYKAEPIPDNVSTALKMRSEYHSEYLRHTYMQNNHDATQILRSWVETSTWTNYPTGESSKDALQRTLVQDNHEENGEYTADGRFDAWYHNVHPGLTAKGVDPLSLHPQEAGDNLNLDVQSSFTMLGSDPFHTFATLSNSLKCFVYTENNYFNTAPIHCRSRCKQAM